jgi:hypothetical protein
MPLRGRIESRRPVVEWSRDHSSRTGELAAAPLLFSASYYDSDQGLTDAEVYAARVHDWHALSDRMKRNSARNNARWRVGYSTWSDDWGPRAGEGIPPGSTGSDVPRSDAVSVPDTRCLAHAQGPNPKCHSASTCLRCPCLPAPVATQTREGGHLVRAAACPSPGMRAGTLTQAQWPELSARVRFPSCTRKAVFVRACRPKVHLRSSRASRRPRRQAR